MTIGLGELKDGLYYLVQDSDIHSSSSLTTKSVPFSSFSAYVKNVDTDLCTLGYAIFLL